MAINVSLIGAGAAGNKAVIDYMTSGADDNVKSVLINSTKNDIPNSFRENSIIFGSTTQVLGGCGKERNLGSSVILDDLRSGRININEIIDKDSNIAVIVTSTEGGTGSAITPIIAKYIVDVIGIPVVVIAFFGFNSDVRGMQNSIEFCQELYEKYAVIGISNYKYLKDSNNNLVQAEKLANKKFIEIMRFISGKKFIPGSQNIDNTDLFKLISTPGYMMIESTDLSKISSVEEFNAAINNEILNSHLLDAGKKGCKRLGVLYDVSESSERYIDFTANNLKEKYGTPYEIFTHIQNDNPSTISWIAAGCTLPLEEVKNIYEEYKTHSAEVNKTQDSFFDELKSWKGNSEDSMFNHFKVKHGKEQTIDKSKENFFAEYGVSSSEDKSKTKKEE